jgi:tetratricopeptide (TPR) repeat protein
MVLLSAAVALAAGEGRMLGKVVDEEGHPVRDATVTITSPDLPQFREITSTKKNGTFSMVFSKAYLRYVYRIEKEGFQTTEQEVKTNLGGTTRHTFELAEGVGAAPVTASGDEPASKSNKAIFSFNAGVEAYDAKDYETAKAKFLEALEADSQLYQAHSALADVFLATGEYQAAVESAEQAISQQSGFLPAHRIRYEAYRELGMEEKAAEAQADIAALGQNSAEAKRIFNEGVEFNKVDDKENALAKFQEAAAMDPSLAPAFNAIAILATNLERWEEAAEASEKLLALQPGDEKALRIRYDAYVNLGEEEKIGDALVDLAQVDAEFAANNLYNLAVGRFNAGNYAGAIELFEEALAINPEHGKAHYYLGLSAINTGDNAKAKEHLARFLEIAPDDSEAPAAQEMIKYLG